MICINCGSENIITITNDGLRKLHLLHWVCPDCKEEYETGWDIDMPPRQDVLEHIMKYKDKMRAYIDKQSPLAFVKVERLPNGIIEFRDSKTNELIGTVINIGDTKE